MLSTPTCAGISGSPGTPALGQCLGWQSLESAVDPKGNIFFSSFYGDQISMISGQSGLLSWYAGMAGVRELRRRWHARYRARDCTAPLAWRRTPTAISFSPIRRIIACGAWTPRRGLFPLWPVRELAVVGGGYAGDGG